jgi:cytosine/creatinine deaminase
MTVPIPKTGSYLLANARVPVDLAGLPSLAVGPDRIVDVEIRVDAGRITAMGPRGTLAAADLARVDLRDGLVLPRFVDSHTHLDKGHIWGRSPNPDGTFMGARMTVAADRESRWHPADVRARMDFALRTAFAHGTAAIRTHLDSIGPQTGISWPVFDEMRAAWRGRIALQAVALFPVDIAIDDEPQFKATVATVAKHGGILGGLSFLGEPPGEKLERGLDRFFAAAAAHGLDLDFHVDESDSLNARSLERIAMAAIRHNFKGRVAAGHCCSLALQSDADRHRVIERLGEANMAVVSLPMCNMYLQDRTPGRTPRWRGVAPLHELEAAGIPVMVASDNTRDPFYAYGDLDMLEVYREATRILHFDHTDRPWPRLLGPASAEIMRLDGVGTLKPGGPAGFVIVAARTWNELNARPQSDRVVVVNGAAIDRTLPDYRELDALES